MLGASGWWVGSAEEQGEGWARAAGGVPSITGSHYLTRLPASAWLKVACYPASSGLWLWSKWTCRAWGRHKQLDPDSRKAFTRAGVQAQRYCSGPEAGISSFAKRGSCAGFWVSKLCLVLELWLRWKLKENTEEVTVLGGHARCGGTRGNALGLVGRSCRAGRVAL